MPPLIFVETWPEFAEDVQLTSARPASKPDHVSRYEAWNERMGGNGPGAFAFTRASHGGTAAAGAGVTEGGEASADGAVCAVALPPGRREVAKQTENARMRTAVAVFTKGAS